MFVDPRHKREAHLPQVQTNWLNWQVERNHWNRINDILDARVRANLSETNPRHQTQLLSTFDLGEDNRNLKFINIGIDDWSNNQSPEDPLINEIE